MTEKEFEIYFAQFRDRIINDGMRAYGVSKAVATKIVEKDLIEITRAGFKAKLNHWFTLIDERSANVGFLWLSIRGEGDGQTPYLSDLYLAPNLRGKGWGKQALSLLEAELKIRGIKNNIAVHIIGDFNEPALRLFKSSGYFVTAIMMEKSISAQ